MLRSPGENGATGEELYLDPLSAKVPQDKSKPPEHSGLDPASLSNSLGISLYFVQAVFASLGIVRTARLRVAQDKISGAKTQLGDECVV